MTNFINLKSCKNKTFIRKRRENKLKTVFLFNYYKITDLNPKHCIKSSLNRSGLRRKDYNWFQFNISSEYITLNQ